MARFDKIPPMGEIPVPDLSRLRVEQPKTVHLKITIFQGCQVGISIQRDESGKVHHYQLKIIDPQEDHEYAFNFLQDLREVLTDSLLNLPAIGSSEDD